MSYELVVGVDGVEDDLERVAGPAVVLRVSMPGEHGAMVTVEWAEAPTGGELIVVARRMLGLDTDTGHVP